MINEREEVFILGRMVQNMRDTSKLTRDLAMEDLNSQMEIILR